MRIIDKLALRDNEWRNMALVITKDKDMADDVVQEFYIKFPSKVERSKTIKLTGDYKFYVFIALKNLYRDLIKSDSIGRDYENLVYYDDFIDSEYDFMESIDVPCDSDFNIESKELFEDFYSKIEHYIRCGHITDLKQYQVGLLALNKLEGLSMRKIENKTGITLRKIQFNINKARVAMEQKFEQDYIDYKNYLTQCKNNNL